MVNCVNCGREMTSGTWVRGAGLHCLKCVPQEAVGSPGPTRQEFDEVRRERDEARQAARELAKGRMVLVDERSEWARRWPWLTENVMDEDNDG
jgi:hypothetical protein